MGSKSSSATSSTTNNTQQTQNLADYSQGDGTRNTTAIAGNGNSVSITATDFGAVAGGLGVASKALDFGGTALKDSLDFANDQASRTVDTVKNIASSAAAANASTADKVLALTETVKTDGQAQTSRLLTGVVLAMVVGVVVVVVVMNRKGK